MSLEIINKDRKDRTEIDLQNAFNILFCNDGTVTGELRYSEVRPNLHKILDNLQLLSKSRLLQCELCPFNFKCRYIVKIKTEINSIVRIGRNLHLANEVFWDKASKQLERNLVGLNTVFWTGSLLKQIYQAREDKLLFKVIRNNYFSLIPEQELTDQIIEMANAFVKFEYERIKNIFDKVGQTSDTIQRYVKPVACEIPIENYSNNLMGVIDRIDYTTNDRFVIVEYKFGKPKYVDIQWQKRIIMRELCFYRILLEGNEVYAVTPETNNLVPILEALGMEQKPIPYYGAMVFFQDLEGTNYIHKLKQQSIRATREAIDTYWYRLNFGKFQPKPIFGKKSDCMDWCKYYEDICEYNPVWLAIDNVM